MVGQRLQQPCQAMRVPRVHAQRVVRLSRMPHRAVGEAEDGLAGRAELGGGVAGRRRRTAHIHAQPAAAAVRGPRLLGPDQHIATRTQVLSRRLSRPAAASARGPEGPTTK